VGQLADFLPKARASPRAVDTTPRSVPYAPVDEAFLRGRRIFMEAYGCQMNVNDAEIAWSILQKAGCLRATSAEEVRDRIAVWSDAAASTFIPCLSSTPFILFTPSHGMQSDVVLLVTCAIRENAEQKIWTRLSQLRALKRALRNERYLQIGVLGCMAGWRL
jgi:hypothetical protein